MDLKVISFLFGVYILSGFIMRFVNLLKKIWGLGARITPARYGKDSWALVTGCTAGIGKDIALELAKEGFNIVVVSRNEKKLNEVCDEIKKVNP